MSVAGLGVDIVEISRMERALAKSPSIRLRAFSAKEQAFCDKNARPAVCYALRFAAKEAVLKALGSGFSGMKFTDVEVEIDERRKAIPVLHGRAALVAEEAGIVEMHLALSSTHTTAVASAIAITPDARPAAKDEKVDPRALLAASFKELRKELDALDTLEAQQDGDELFSDAVEECDDTAEPREEAGEDDSAAQLQEDVQEEDHDDATTASQPRPKDSSPQG